jgi:hypothetical protein
MRAMLKFTDSTAVFDNNLAGLWILQKTADFAINAN